MDKLWNAIKNGMSKQEQIELIAQVHEVELRIIEASRAEAFRIVEGMPISVEEQTRFLDASKYSDV